MQTQFEQNLSDDKKCIENIIQLLSPVQSNFNKQLIQDSFYHIGKLCGGFNGLNFNDSGNDEGKCYIRNLYG